LVSLSAFSLQAFNLDPGLYQLFGYIRLLRHTLQLLFFFSHSDHVLPRNLFANLRGPTIIHGASVIEIHTASAITRNTMSK